MISINKHNKIAFTLLAADATKMNEDRMRPSYT